MEKPEDRKEKHGRDEREHQSGRGAAQPEKFRERPQQTRDESSFNRLFHPFRRLYRARAFAPSSFCVKPIERMTDLRRVSNGLRLTCALKVSRFEPGLQIGR